MSEKNIYLMHHGIKGQQWGTQNGPPYPLDEKVKAIAYRGGYDKDGNKLTDASKSDVKEARRKVNKSIRFMSTQDLNEYKNRLMLEESIEDITGTNWYKKRGKRVLENIDKIFTEGSVSAGKTLVKNAELFAAGEALESLLGKNHIDTSIADKIIMGPKKDKEKKKRNKDDDDDDDDD